MNEGLKHIVSTISDFRVQAQFDSFQEMENDSVLKKCTMLVCNPELIRSDRSLTKFRIRNPQVKVLVVDQERNAYKEFLNPATVDGYIFLCCDTEEVLKALLAVSKGEKFFCEKALGYMLNSRENLSTCSPVNLSERELEILKLITEGYSSKEISSQLFVSFHTVATHRKNICRKLGVNKVGELIAAAHKLNLA